MPRSKVHTIQPASLKPGMTLQTIPAPRPTDTVSEGDGLRRIADFMKKHTR